MVGMPSFCTHFRARALASAVSTLRRPMQSEADGHRSYLGPTLAEPHLAHQQCLPRQINKASWLVVLTAPYSKDPASDRQMESIRPEPWSWEAMTVPKYSLY